MSDVPLESLSIPHEQQVELLRISEERDQAIREFDELSSQRLEKKHQIENLSDRQNELLRKIRGEPLLNQDDADDDAGQQEMWEEPAPTYQIHTDDSADAELEATAGD